MCAEHLLGLGRERQKKREVWMHEHGSSAESSVSSAMGSTVGTDSGCDAYRARREGEALKTSEGRRAHRKLFHGGVMPPYRHAYHV